MLGLASQTDLPTPYLSHLHEEGEILVIIIPSPMIGQGGYNKDEDFLGRPNKEGKYESTSSKSDSIQSMGSQSCKEFY